MRPPNSGESRLPETSKEWDRRLDDALEKASVEAIEGDNPELARMMTVLRLYLAQWQDIAQSRLRAMGVHALSETEYDTVVKMVANEVARQTVDAAKQLVTDKRHEWWQHWAIKVGAVVGIVSLIASTFFGVINLILNLHALR